ncbi:MAG TPA: recombinase family protein [Hyphomicrobiales bacterium]|nr:recombinase family protein [Hyphomicrobiales bacterium]
MKTDTPAQAVIYCRVSTTAQMKKGDGLASQETRCREYASHKGYEIVQVFRDEGVSGGMIDRPGMQAMLAFLKKHRRLKQHVVIIDDISRLARGLEAHIQLRTSIGDAGGRLESPSIEFGEDSDSQLIENLLASVSQHQRQKNAEQTKNRMRARASNGYWVFWPPAGYRFEHMKGQGKVMVEDESLAPIVRQALESFASGRFDTQAEVRRFLASHPEFPRDGKGDIRAQRVTDMLTNVLYAGFINLPNWGIRLVPAKHEPLISFATYQAIQERLNSGAKVPARQDISEDFPLRGFIKCGHCSTPLTACWSKGRHKTYPYYLCPTRGCASYGKSIRRAEIEGDFSELLEGLRPSPGLFNISARMLRKIWDARQDGTQTQSRSLKTELRATEKKVDQFLDRIAETDSPALIGAYEKRIRALEERKIELSEKIGECGRPLGGFDETFRTAMSFLANPCKLWVSDRLDYKRTVLKLVFADRLYYIRNEGFRTADLSIPFKVLADLREGKSNVALPRGIEPLFPD